MRLSHPPRRTLKRNLNTPVTCKIRLLEDIKDTITLAKTLEACNVWHREEGEGRGLEGGT